MSDQPQTATIIDGRYRVLGRVGSGGMADVYSAEDLQLGRVVAVKLLHRRFAEDEEFVERFRREASAAAGLQHPNVVSVYDRGSWDGTYYIAMELLEGRSLKRLITEEAPLDPDRAIELTLQILRAARFAHRRGVIHRDLKPHNVIVDDGPPPRAKVTDFGIARAGASDMTQTGSIMGTAQYLSPEQAQGLAVDARSDLYAIGVILYEMLTARVPFEGESAVTIALKHVSEEPEPPHRFNPAVSDALDAVVLCAMAKDPDDRFGDAEAFAEALEDAREGTITGTMRAVTPVAPVPIPPAHPYGEHTPPPVVLDPRAGGGGRRWWLAALFAVLLVGGVLAALLLSQDEATTVPDVVGAPRAEAEIRLKREGFSTDVTLKQSLTAAEGTVFGQSPSGGAKLDQGEVVQLTVSSGPGTARIPDLTGERRSDAEQQLRDLGFEVDEARQSSDALRTGRVIVTRPAAGEELERGQTVTVVLSTGRPVVSVPTVTGQSESDARGALEDRGLVVTTQTRETSDEDEGTVLEQDPAPGTSVRQGSTVTLTVAKAPVEAEVPDVTGQPQDAATSALRAAGFTVSAADAPTDTPDGDGVVLSQEPAEGTARKGSQVTITVGRFDPALDPEPDPGTTTPAATTPADTTTTAPAP